MRPKEWRLIVTFHTTTEAIACERVCKKANMAGRMIPVPRELSTSCGLAWCARPEEQGMLEQLFLKEKVVFEKMVQLEF